MNDEQQPQKTLRDEIAIEAMIQILKRERVFSVSAANDLAGIAYMVADAMMKARNG